MAVSPFIKYVGGKSSLYAELDSFHQPVIENIDVIVESFVGGGAYFLKTADRYPHIKKFVISDVSTPLINVYKVIRDKNVDYFIRYLNELELEFNSKPNEELRKDFFLQKRSEFNKLNLTPEIQTNYKIFLNEYTAAVFVFLNKTCFNGLFRVNRQGKFNVGFNKTKKVSLYDLDNIQKIHEILQKTEIFNFDFEKLYNFATPNTLFYFDPPYLEISKTSNFTSYTKEGFDIEDHKRLNSFCKRITILGSKFMLSNSYNEDNSLLQDLFSDFNINKIMAARSVNSDGTKRGKIAELLIKNF